MLALQVYAPTVSAAEAVALLAAEPSVDHVVQLGQTADRQLTLITADVESGALDQLLPKLVDCGVSPDQLTVLHQESNRPLGTSRGDDLPTWSGGALAWTELSMASRQYARAVPQYLIFMGCAGVIAALGVLTRNSILIVGAMAISPDLLPLCATCVGIVDRHPRLAGRAFAALLLGLAMAGLTAYLVTTGLRAYGYSPASAPLGTGGLGGLPTVNASTVIVAFFAGIAGILAFETRSSSAVGVAISITTIPAAAYLGAALAQSDDPGSGGALAVLGANVTVLLVAGSITLSLQRMRRGRMP